MLFMEREMQGTGRVLFKGGSEAEALNRRKVSERGCRLRWKRPSPEEKEVHPGAGLLKARRRGLSMEGASLQAVGRHVGVR